MLRLNSSYRGSKFYKNYYVKGPHRLIWADSFYRKIHRDGRNVVLLQGVRTDFYPQGAEYVGVEGYKMAALVIKAVMQKNKLSHQKVENCIFGSMIQYPEHLNLARDASLYCGLHDLPSFTISNHCASSLSALMTAYSSIAAGTYSSIIVGGVETTSAKPGEIVVTNPRFPTSLKNLRYNMKRYLLKKFKYLYNNISESELDIDIVNPLTGECSYHESSRLFGSQSGLDIGSLIQDVVLSSYRNARCRDRAGLLDDVVSLDYFRERDIDKFDIENIAWRLNNPDVDMYMESSLYRSNLNRIRMECDLLEYVGSSLVAKLADGAAATWLMEEKEALKNNIVPEAYIRDIVFTSNNLVSSSRYGVLTSLALLLSKNSLYIEDINVLEVHENTAIEMLFIYQCISGEINAGVSIPKIPQKHNRPFNAEKICNLWGGSLAYNHPFGATGIRLLNMACNRLRADSNAKYAVVSMSSYGGMGCSVLLEKYEKP